METGNTGNSTCPFGDWTSCHQPHVENIWKFDTKYSDIYPLGAVLDTRAQRGATSTSTEILSRTGTTLNMQPAVGKAKKMTSILMGAEMIDQHGKSQVTVLITRLSNLSCILLRLEAICLLAAKILDISHSSTKLQLSKISMTTSRTYCDPARSTNRYSFTAKHWSTNGLRRCLQCWTTTFSESIFSFDTRQRYRVLGHLPP